MCVAAVAADAQEFGEGDFLLKISGKIAGQLRLSCAFRAQNQKFKSNMNAVGTSDFKEEAQ